MEIKTLIEKIQLHKTTNFLKKCGPSLKWVLILSVSAGIGGMISLPVASLYVNSRTQESTSTSETSENCDVQGINLHGFLTTYIPPTSSGNEKNDSDSTASEDVMAKIDGANKNPKIKAIIIETDSAGGTPVAGEEISKAVKNSKKPVVAFIRNQGDSSAYWSISSADRIFASRNSDVGSIGVTQSYLDSTKKNNKDGYTYEQLSSGKFKDSGSVNKTLTSDERALFMRDINIVFNNFVEDVALNRKLPVDKVKAIADGSTVLGE
ncbi:MAG: S49 family peptidase, partial [bacterium]